MGRQKGLIAPQNTFLDHIGARFNGTQSNFLLGNAQVPGAWPIVYCSDGFCTLTGFPRSQIMQRSCSCDFMYGDETSSEEIDKLRLHFETLKELQTKMTLYKKDGTPFTCLLDVVPITDDGDTVVMFLVSHKEVTNDDDDGDDDDDQFATSHPNRVNTYQEYPASEDSSEHCSFNQLSDRRRSRAVLYNISENFQPKAEKKGFFNLFTQRIFGRAKSTVPEYKFANTEKSKWTIAHSGMGKTLWDWFVVLVTIYVTAVVPYYAAIQSVPVSLRSENASSTTTRAFHVHSKDGMGHATVVVDIIVELTFIADIILTFFTTFVNKNGWVVSDGRLIALNYFKTWFWIDLVAALPVDTISHVFHIDFGAQPVPLLKTVRLLRLFRLFHNIDRWSQYSAVVLLLLLLMFVLVAHWLACVWLTIGWNEVQKQRGVGWLYELSTTLQVPFNSSGAGGPDVTSTYITSLYFTLSSLTSVGFGNVSANTNNEKIFSICVMMIGALMHAVVFGNVTAIIQRMYARRSQYDIKTRDLKDFVKVHRLSKTVKRRMIEHFQRTWGESRGVNPAEIMNDFPREIQADVALHLHREVFNLPVFRIENEGFRRYLSLHTRRCTVAPGGHVIYVGDPLETVNVVCKGSLEVREEKQLTCILGKGEVFGAEVHPDKPIMSSKADVKAMTYCELECISVKGLLAVFDLYPEFAGSLMADLKADYSCNLWEKSPMFRRSLSREDIESPRFATPLQAERRKAENDLSDLSDEDAEEWELMPLVDRRGSDQVDTDEYDTTLLGTVSPLESPGVSNFATERTTSPNESLNVNDVMTQVEDAVARTETPITGGPGTDPQEQSYVRVSMKDKECDRKVIKRNSVKPEIVTTTCFEPCNTSLKPEKKRKRLISFFRTLSTTFIQSATEKERNGRQNSTFSLAPDAGEGFSRPSCIRKRSTDASSDPTTRRCRSVSEIYGGKRVTFFDMVNENAVGKSRQRRGTRKKSASVCGDDIKNQVASSPNLTPFKSMTINVTQSESISEKEQFSDNEESPTANDNTTTVTSQKDKRVSDAARDAQPKTHVARLAVPKSVPLGTSLNQKLVSPSRSPSAKYLALSRRPLTRRRRRQRRKSFSPHTSSQALHKRLHTDGREFLSDTVTLTRPRRKKNSARVRIDSSGSEAPCSDNVFGSMNQRSLPAAHQYNQYRNGSDASLLWEQQNQYLVDSMRELISEVAFLREEVQNRCDCCIRSGSPRLASSRESLVSGASSYIKSYPTSSDYGSTLRVPMSYSTSSMPNFRTHRLSGESSYDPMLSDAVEQDEDGKTAADSEKGLRSTDFASCNESKNNNVNVKSPPSTPSVCLTTPAGDEMRIDMTTNAMSSRELRETSVVPLLHNFPAVNGKENLQPENAKRSFDAKTGLSPDGYSRRGKRNHVTCSRDDDARSPDWYSRFDHHDSRGRVGSVDSSYCFPFDKNASCQSWTSCTDTEGEWSNCQLNIPQKTGGKDRESGYNSTSPTIQLQDKFR